MRSFRKPQPSVCQYWICGKSALKTVILPIPSSLLFEVARKSSLRCYRFYTNTILSKNAPLFMVHSDFSCQQCFSAIDSCFPSKICTANVSDFDPFRRKLRCAVHTLNRGSKRLG